MTLKKSFKFFFLGLLLGISQSFLFCIPLIIFVYYSFLKNVYKMTSYKYGFFLQLALWNGFFYRFNALDDKSFFSLWKTFLSYTTWCLNFSDIDGCFFYFSCLFDYFFWKKPSINEEQTLFKIISRKFIFFIFWNFKIKIIRRSSIKFDWTYLGI